jgi:probable HAF family extracellular repeat protein
MKRHPRALMLAISFAAALHVHTAAVHTAPGRASSYAIEALVTLGGTENFAYAINDDGDVVGSSRISADVATHSFLYRRGRLTDLYPLNSEFILTVGPTGINNAGQIASGLIHGDGVYYPALYDGSGAMTMLGSLGGVTSWGFSGTATSVNNHGQAVGYSYVDDVTRHAFLWSGGVMTDIGLAGGYSGALRINDSGQAVGFASDTPYGFAHAFVYSEGVATIINPFGGPQNEGYATGINQQGQVVGQALTAAGYSNAFLYSSGASSSLGTLKGGHNSAAYAINRKGQIVGIADYPYPSRCWDPYTESYVPCIQYAQHAFVFDDGGMSDLNALIPRDSGWDLEWAFDINDSGQIVGYGRLHGAYRAYLLTRCESRGRGRGQGNRCRTAPPGR